MTSDNSTPPDGALTPFFRDAPLWQSGLAFFFFIQGINTFVDQVFAVRGSRALVDVLVHVCIYGAGALVLARLARARSRLYSAASPPSAV